MVPGDRTTVQTYLRNSKELLGDVNNTRELLDVVHTLLDSAGVVGTGSVQNVLVLLNLTLSPLAVDGATVLGSGSEDAEKTEGSNGLLVHDIEFIADGGNGDTGGGGDEGGLGDQAVAGESVDNRLSLLLGVLGGDVGGRTRRGQAGSDGSDVARGKGRPEPGSTC